MSYALQSVPPSAPTTSNRLASLFGLVAVVAFTFLAMGCDSVESDPPSSSTGESTVAGKGLASAPPGSDLFIEAHGSTKGDFFYEPVAIPPGGEFIAELLAGPPPYTVLARMLHRGLSDGRVQVEVDVSEFGSNGFAMEMLFGSEVEYSQYRPATAAEVVGSLRQEPTSFHYEVIEDEDGRTVMVTVDYEREAVGGSGIAWITPNGGGEKVPCTDLAITPARQFDAEMEIAGVRLRGVDVADVHLVEQHIE